MRNLWKKFRLWWAMQKIIAYYKSVGSEMPIIDAYNELQERVLLEELRDYVSEKYLAEGGMIHDYREEWLKANMNPKKDLWEWTRVANFRSVVRDMHADELLHPDAFKKWDDEIMELCRDVNEARLEKYPLGYSELEERVLLGVG